MYSCISASNFQLLNYLVSTILKRNQLQKWSRRLNDICKTKRLWRTLCHLALWLVLTGSRLKELGRHLQRSENHWQMPLLSCWRRNFANKLIWCVIFSLMWTHLGNSLYNPTDKTIYNVYIREGGRNGVLGYWSHFHHQCCLSEIGARSFSSPRQLVSHCQSCLYPRTVTHCISRSFSTVLCHVSFSLVFSFWYPHQYNSWKGTVIHSQLVSYPCLSSCRTLALGNPNWTG